MLEIDLFFNTFAFLYMIVFFVTLFFYKLYYKTKRIKLSFIGIFEMYLLMLIKVVILPIRMITDDNLKMEVLKVFSISNVIQLKPFRSISAFWESGNYLQIGGNILLLLPLPIFLYFLLKKNNAKRILIISFIFSLGIEIIQLCICLCTHFASRVFDIDDILLNCIGVVLGYGFCCILKKLQNKYIYT